MCRVNKKQRTTPPLSACQSLTSKWLHVVCVLVTQITSSNNYCWLTGDNGIDGHRMAEATAWTDGWAPVTEAPNPKKPSTSENKSCRLDSSAVLACEHTFSSPAGLHSDTRVSHPARSASGEVTASDNTAEPALSTFK